VPLAEKRAVAEPEPEKIAPPPPDANPVTASVTEQSREQPLQRDDDVASIPLPAAKPADSAPRPEPPVQATRVPEQPRRPDARPRGRKSKPKNAVDSTPSVASSGVGRGRSDAESNYRGLVAAHLARHKQFPADAQRTGEQGSAVVRFTLDGSGRVKSAQLVRKSSVASLDREAVAMVHRASPFPAPPDGRPVTFSVPVSFRLAQR
jgi:protein TonB